ncbi:glycosyltransferase family 2 protein [Kitasatospora sp. NPDC096147]|uniref:glycosyltransferase family 2 protein n=1 Tax=Kitasatospora sp. NPDC096147 TaxID=3364093 RepID=UPI00380547D1
MNGNDRRTEAACPCPAARDTLDTPVHVVELDLAVPGELRSPGGTGPAAPDGRVLALVRLHGHPLGLVEATGADPADPGGTYRALVVAAHRALGPAPDWPAPRRAPSTSATSGGPPRRVGGPRMPAGPPPRLSVVIATHDRPELLRQCLDSLLRADGPPYEVLVVDNAPSGDDAHALIRARYAGRVRYLREPVAGLARAHNLGLAAARGELTAFTDDDTLVDRHWPAVLTEAFDSDPRIGCVTGLILPTELATPAQAALHRQGGYQKGFSERRYALDLPSGDPLFPFTAGQFGSGANMAFRTGLLRALGGFDPATGAGTPAHGGDDLLAFFRIVSSGLVLDYRPDAIVWHRHRRTADALAAQLYGYGAGLGAYLAAAVSADPRLLPVLLRRLPGGLRRALGQAGHRTTADGARSTRLALLELSGMLYGPLGYLRSQHQTERRLAADRRIARASAGAGAAGAVPAPGTAAGTGARRPSLRTG